MSHETSLEAAESISRMKRQIADRAAAEIVANVSNPYFGARPDELRQVIVNIVLGASRMMAGETRN